ncbi:hypothetical protein BDN72DRAFT_509981 [Pluteus cervinus]|uniref:Uncharacterized protein n=1 Tax=Pluteus cervinus TaxID=181527 RepID=A0ACD3BB95_9AGAR|nr:hypothetical protein BDN72DRAFT_509981 [Pluteus cervinus]
MRNLSVFFETGSVRIEECQLVFYVFSEAKGRHFTLSTECVSLRRWASLEMAQPRSGSDGRLLQVPDTGVPEIVISKTLQVVGGRKKWAVAFIWMRVGAYTFCRVQSLMITRFRNTAVSSSIAFTSRHVLYVCTQCMMLMRASTANDQVYAVGTERDNGGDTHSKG